MEPFSGLGCLPFCPLEGKPAVPVDLPQRHVQECSSPLGAPDVATLGKEGWSLTHPVLAPVCKCPAWHSTMFTALGVRGPGAWLGPAFKAVHELALPDLSRLQLSCPLPCSASLIWDLALHGCLYVSCCCPWLFQCPAQHIVHSGCTMHHSRPTVLYTA